MTARRAPRPKPLALTPEQKAHAIDLRNEQPRDIAALDRPAREVAADVKAFVARQRCQVLADAAMRSSSPSDRIAYALDGWLITHPDAPVSTDLDYPNWTPGGAS